MPTYLLHGFRWHREAIRIHIVMNNLDDAAAEWILAPATSLTLLNSFYTNFDFLPPSNPPRQKYDIPIPPIPADEEEFKPRTLKKGHKASISSLRSLRRKNRPPNLASPKNENGTRVTEPSRQPHSTSTSMSSILARKDPALVNFNEWSAVKLMEQHDPNDEKVVSQPWAYVADYMVAVTLSASLKEEAAKYEERNREADWPLSSPSSPAPVKGEQEKGHGYNSSMDLAGKAMSPREIRRKSRRVGWIEKLRDGLQKEEEVGWFVVYCGDEERASPEIQKITSWEETEDESPQRTPRSASFRAFFRGRSNTVEE